MARDFTNSRLAAVRDIAGGMQHRPKYTQTVDAQFPAYKELGASNVVQGDWKPAQPSDQVARGKWWESFHDPQLNRLEEKLNISNQNIVAAAANVQAARAMIREARAQYFPTLTANPGITNSRLSTAFGQSIGANFHHFFAAAGSFLGARPLGPHSKYGKSQYVRGPGQRRRSGKRSPVRASRTRRRLLSSFARRTRSSSCWIPP